MPYQIKKQGKEFCVVKETTGEVVKCHESHSAAMAHMAALYANVSDAKSEPGILYRDVPITGESINEESRTIDLSFSSEQPVQRYDWEDGKYYNEILSHKAEDVDLSRLNNSHPLLVNHERDDQVGVIEKAEIGNDLKGRATVRFSKSQRATEIWNDVRDGIRRLVSVGYRLGRELSRELKDGMETVRYSWTPFEVSLVSIPADTTVGVGRQETKPLKENRFMPEENNNPAQPTIEVLRQNAEKEVRERFNEIDAIAKRLEVRIPKIGEMATKAKQENWSVDQFRDEALKALPEIKIITPPEPLKDVKPKDWRNYSLSRAIINQLPDRKFDGFEKEMSDEVSLKTGKRAGGFWVPNEVMTRNFIAGTGTLGGMLVQTDNLASEFIELLRNKSQVMALGARTLNLSNPVTIPRQSGAGTANWVGETVAATLSTGNFTQITLTPNGVSAFQQYSKQLLFESNPSIDSLIRDDITQILALAIDLAALHGTGSGQPTGIVGTTGIGTVALAANGQALSNATAYPALVSLETLVSTANADMGALAYLARPTHRGSLRTTTRFASTDTPVWAPMGNGANGGTVNGYRAEVTNQLATNLTTGTATTITSCIIFGNWNEVLIGNFNNGAVDLVVDPYTLAANAVVRLIARQWVDIGIRHPASFAVLGGIL